MLFYKWCPFLTRTMSPLIVGLIWCCLVGVSSLSLHSTNSSRSTANIANFKNNANYSSFAKDNILHRKRLFTGFQRTTSRVSTSSKPVINNGSIETRNKKMPHLHLNSRLRVRNASEENSTIVFLPRLNRSMGNFSEKSENRDLQPIIVSKHRRILLDPKEYKVRRSSDTRSHFPKDSISSQFGLKLKLKFSQNSTHNNPSKFGQTSQLFSKIIKTTQTPNILKVIKPASVNNPFYSESKILVHIKSNKNSTDTKNSSVQFLPANISRNENRIIPRIYKRKGRNFDVSDETSSEEFISFLSHDGNTNSTSQNNTGVRTKSLSSSHSLKEPAYQPDSSSLESFEQPFSDLGYSYAEKKAKNLTIYEILKPRLKSFISEGADFLPDQNSSYWQNNTVSYQGNDMVETKSLNSSSIDIVDDEDVSNNTFVTNEIDDGIPNYENPMVIIPGRSDSSYGVEYIMVNRSNFAIIPPPENGDYGLSINVESGDDKNNNSVIPSELYDTSSSVNLDSASKEKNSSVTSLETEDTGISIKEESGDHENNSSVKVFTEKSPNTTKNGYKIYKREGFINVAAYLPKDILRIKHEENSNVSDKVTENSNKTLLKNASAENLSADGSEYRTLFYESDFIRRPKMTETVNNGNTPFKHPKLDSKIFYDYFAKRPTGNATLREFPYPEYRPGNMFRYSDIYQRKPILDAVLTRPLSIPLLKTDPVVVTEETASMEVNPTTFNSLRSSSSVRVLSTYYPNRMQDVTMKFGNRIETTTVPNSREKKPEYRNEYDPDDAEFKDSIDPGFTMEKLAYLLIGTCCGLSILCLFVVVIAIKCRRAIVEKRLKSQFKKRMYHHERMTDMTNPWQQQMFDHFMYLHRRPGDSSCSSNTDSCNCRCVTWSLGARNLDATRPLCPTSRNSLYLYGQKKLPFGAASTLRFESMLGRKKSPDHNQKTDSPHTDSSHENDSLDLDSDSREGDGPKQCTCIDYNIWQMPPPNVPRGFFTVCSNPRRYNVGNCSQHHPVDLRTIARDLPPPVTGSNYLDRSEGVVYWSSNEERLI